MSVHLFPARIAPIEMRDKWVLTELIHSRFLMGRSSHSWSFFMTCLSHFYGLSQPLVACIMHFRNGVIKDGALKNRYSSLTRNNFDLTYIVLAALQNDYAINLQNGTSVENCLCLSTVPALYIYAGLYNVPFLASKKGWQNLWKPSVPNNILKNLSLILCLYRVETGLYRPAKVPVYSCVQFYCLIHFYKRFSDNWHENTYVTLL